MLSGLFFLGGYVFFNYWAFSVGLFKHLPLLMNTDIAISYAIGPFLYLYFCAISGAKKMKSQIMVIHFTPFLVSLTCLLIMNLSSSLPLTYYRDMNLLFPEYSYNPFIRIVSYLSNISLGIYFFLTLFQISFFFRSKKICPEIRIVLIFLLLLTLNGIFLLVADFFHKTVLILIGIGCFSLLPMYYIFFSFRYPEFSIKVIKEARTMRYEHSIVKNLDIELIQTRLTELMTEERLFVGDSLSLQSRSAYLKITPHQLSQVLNDRLNLNFSTYINAFRIQETKKLLTDRPDRSILEIAYSVGFNSKSSFYSSFIKDTGLPPTEYRKKYVN